MGFTKSGILFSPQIAEVKKKNGSGRRYLLSILDSYRGMGPNAQYKVFKKHLALAIKLNRTFVDKGFISHWTEHSIHRPRFINETFNMARLERIANFATVEEFKKDCNSTVEAVVPNLSPHWRFVNAQQQYSEMYGINIPDNFSVNHTLESSSDLKCIGFFMVHLPTKLKPALRFLVNEHLVSPADIEKVADDVMRKLCHGQPYIALHWRGKIQEMYHICIEDGKNVSYCEEINIRSTQETIHTAQIIAKNLKTEMEQRNMKYIYVAFPPIIGKLVVDHFKMAEVPGVLSKEDIIKYPAISAKQHDNYWMSLLEQEICTCKLTIMRATTTS
ncbi:uncharacterized protein LOC144350621 [Saccoglossus kowalevskii]